MAVLGTVAKHHPFEAPNYLGGGCIISKKQLPNLVLVIVLNLCNSSIMWYFTELCSVTALPSFLTGVIDYALWFPVFKEKTAVTMYSS